MSCLFVHSSLPFLFLCSDAPTLTANQRNLFHRRHDAYGALTHATALADGSPLALCVTALTLPC